MRTFAQKENQPQKPVSSNLPGSRSTVPGLHHSADNILHLQRTIGNHAVQRILQTHAEEPNVRSATTASPRFSHDFCRAPLHSPVGGAVQAKRAINEPGDEYEREADRAAERVMNMAAPPLAQHGVQQQPSKA